MIKIGQRVKVIASKDELSLHSAERGHGCTGTVIDTRMIGDDMSCHVKLEGKSTDCLWYKLQHLELIPDDGKQPPTPPVKYPPLRVMATDSQPSQTWQQVLASKPLAVSQPHLFLRGIYDLWTIEDMRQADELYIVMDCVPLPDVTIYYRVFVIAEGEQS